MLVYLLVVVISYFMGTISCAYLISKYIFSKDIRQYGSKNPGTTNMLRTFGKKAGGVTLVGDYLKGTIAVLISSFLAKKLGADPDLARYISALAVVCGHNWSVFMRFRGGKGVATTFGVLYCLFFKEVFICSILGLVILYITRYVSLSGLITLLNTNILMFLLDVEIRYIYFTFFLFCIVTFKHKENIKRLINHTERKLGEK